MARRHSPIAASFEAAECRSRLLPQRASLLRENARVRDAERRGDARAESARASQTASERPAKILEAVQTFFDDVDTGGVTKAHGAVIAESGARNDGDVRLAQQTVRKILRSEPELANVDQHIKRALRLDCGNIRNFGNPIEHIVATHIEFFAHIGKRLLISLQSRERAIL